MLRQKNLSQQLLFRWLKPLIERCPEVAFAYRTIRDKRALYTQKAQTTPLGFKLIGNKAMQSGTFEPEETALLRHDLSCGETDVFVDVGANIGYYTCLARSHNIDTIAVEPLPANLDFLYVNLNENGWCDVEVFPVALSNKPAITTLYGAGTGASLIGGWADTSPLLRQTIAVSTLDILLGSRFEGKRLVIKIDVEGAEYSVLAGAPNTLAMSPRPTWLVEICLSEHHPTGINPDFVKTFNTFWQNGYYAMTADRKSKVVFPDDVKRALSTGTCEWGHNFVFKTIS